MATVFLIENVLVCGAGAVAGALLGAALAPAFAVTSAEILGGGAEASFPALPLLAAVAIVLTVAAFFSWVPARQRAGKPIVGMLSAPIGARRSRMHADARRLGLPLAALVGIKDAFARPGRAALVALSLALAVAALVAALAMEASLALDGERASDPGPLPPMSDAAGDPLTPEPALPDDADRMRPLVYGLDAITLAVAVVTLLTTTMLALRERARELGVLRALGFTPAQLLYGVMANQLLLAVAALTVGIPLGLLLFSGAYEAAGGRPEGSAWPPIWQLAVLCAVASVVFCGLAGAAARRMVSAAALRPDGRA